jgi:hypothetical protein
VNPSEHLPPELAVRWLREVRRVLRIGGFPAAQHAASAHAEGYLDGGSFFAQHRENLRSWARGRSRETGLDAQPDLRAWGQKWIYDINEIRAAADAAGFRAEAVTECSFRRGRVPAVATLDLPVRSDESL